MFAFCSCGIKWVSPKVAPLIYLWVDKLIHLHVNMLLGCDHSWLLLLLFPPRRVLPYLGMVGRFHGDDPPFLRFSILLGPSFMPHHDLIDPIFLRKIIGLSLSHSVPEILGPKVCLIYKPLSHSIPEILRPKVGLIFHQMFYFNYF